MAYTQALTTVVPGTAAILQRGERHIQVQFSGDSGEPVITKEFQYYTDDQLKSFVKSFRDSLNAALSAAIVSGVVPDPVEVVDVAGPLRQWISDVNDLLRLQSVLTAMNAVTPPAGDPTTHWNLIKSGLTTRINNIITSVGATYNSATGPQKTAGITNL